MKVEQGREAVWQHAGEAGLQDDIRRIAAVFELANVQIETPGKITYLRERFPEYKRIRPFENNMRIDVPTGRLIKK